MNPREYTRMAAYERWYWWYRARQENLREAIEALDLPDDAMVLDAGCGSGSTLRMLRQARPVRAFGMDASDHAAALWAREDSGSLCRASVNALPYADDAFDLVYSVDVLCCAGVDVSAALNELARVVRPGGHVLLWLPAYEWMRSRHDDAVQCVRRFSRAELHGLAERAGLRVRRCRHLFAAMFPLVATVRLLGKFGRRRRRITSDLTAIPAWLNRVLLSVSRQERRLTRRVGPPFGSTLLLTGWKEPS